MGLLTLRPSEILYSQNTISNKFKNGLLIGEVLDDILNGKMQHNDLPRIEVALINGDYVSADNRRLWILKELEDLGHLEEVVVKSVKSIYRGKPARSNYIKLRGNGPGGNEVVRMSVKFSRMLCNT